MEDLDLSGLFSQNQNCFEQIIREETLPKLKNFTFNGFEPIMVKKMCQKYSRPIALKGDFGTMEDLIGLVHDFPHVSFEHLPT